MSNEQKKMLVIGALIFLIGGLFGLYQLYFKPLDSGELKLIKVKAGADMPTPSVSLVMVHVAGAVRDPGVYNIPAGTRGMDVIRIAGGLADHADLDKVNLAQKVRDGQRIFVPFLKLKSAQRSDSDPVADAYPVSSVSAGGVVNLNAATKAELVQLPGVGPAMADRILLYKSQHGSFSKVEELLEVPGIGPKKFEKLKNSLYL